MVDISIETDSVKKFLDAAVRKYKPNIAKEVYFVVVARTPVDTGRARAAWDISEGSFKSPLPEGAYPYPSMPTIPKTDNDLYIYNPQDYIQDLNEGNSAQAPSLYIDLAVWDVVFRNRKSTSV